MSRLRGNIASLWLASIFFFLFSCSWAAAQTATYHLHNAASTIPGSTFKQLSTSNPSAPTIALSTSLKGKAAGEYVIQEFETQSGVPNAGGVIPSGSSLNFNLWMRKTASVGTVFPRAKIRLNNATGTLLCTATGTIALTGGEWPAGLCGSGCTASARDKLHAAYSAGG